MTFDPAASQIVLGMNAAHPLPALWEVRLPHAGATLLGSNEQWPSVPPEGRLVFPVPAESLNVPITMLQLSWTEQQNRREMLLPVNVQDRAKLPPPETLRSLTSEGILACILSGCGPAEWLDRQPDREVRGGNGNSIDPSIDPHRFHDPSGLALYRVRRLGRALAAMGQRLVATVRTPEAVEYQVHRHPLGRVKLADALVREGSAPVKAGAQTERTRLAFRLMEVALMLANAGKGLHRRRQPGEVDHRTCFGRAVWRVLQQANGVLNGAMPEMISGNHAETSLRQYGAAVATEAEALLGGLRPEENVSCP